MEPNKGFMIARAQEADAILTGPIMQEVFATTEEAFMREWRRAETTQQREMCWAKVTGLEEVKRQLRRIVGKGEHASRQPDER